MVLRQVEDGRAVGHEAVGQRQLITGQLEHPDLWQLARLDRLAQGIERSRADVAGDRDLAAGLPAQMANQLCRGGLAVGAGDCYHLGQIACCTQSRNLAGEKLEFAPDRDAGGAGGLMQCGSRAHRR